MMKTIQAFTLALLAAAMGMWTSVASANHFTGACAAGAKVQLGKAADAVDKLDDISTKLTELVSAPKPKLADGTGITTAVVGAIACVGKLQS